MPNLTTVDVNGPTQNRVNMIFVGDGYRSAEIEGAYAGHVAGIAGHLFASGTLTEPFDRYRNFFNLYRADLVSAESGADDPAAGVFRDTALDASYSWDGATERLLYVDEAKTAAAVDAALAGKDGITPDLVLVTVNDTEYGAGTDRYSVVAGGSAKAEELAAHEVAHSFAGLADEYGGSATRYGADEPVLPNVTTDAGGAKWSQWLGYDQPGIGVIGAYEGALRHDSGLYRPSVDSKMRSLGQPFDAVSREQLVLEIYEKVDPIDDHTPNLRTITGRDSVVAEVVDPAVIKVRWSVDGTVVDEGDSALDLSDNGFGLGTYRVTAFAYDPTDWVRSDRGPLQQTVHWTIDVPTGATEGADTLAGTDRSDKILALAGDDTVSAGRGNDVLKGGDGGDHLIGGAGSDQLFGDGASGDTVRGTAPRTTLAPDIENLSMLAAPATEVAAYAPGDRRQQGNGDAEGFDSSGFDAGDGDDRLNGGLGADRLTGGAGADRFDFDSAAACGMGPVRDVITDFARTEGDKIDLSAIDAAPDAAGDQAFRFVGARAFGTTGGELRCSDGIVQGDLDGDRAADFELRLLGTDTMRAADFVL